MTMTNENTGAASGLTTAASSAQWFVFTSGDGEPATCRICETVAERDEYTVTAIYGEYPADGMERDLEELRGTESISFEDGWVTWEHAFLSQNEKEVD